ncbi:MAG TPA: sigma-E factor negative regulatory protein [Caldimonas sp.]|nr:sigma-E factor negative regulatory protein [Caldimonas sp.]HEX4234929.1 sigma-E factor negative regulatory protein [Caldimonas sp.]
MAMESFDDAARERLSALADGELDGAEPVVVCAAWAGSAEARQDWHAWHLIGDVLRSEDLASDPRRDRQLCAAVRARLEKEPVVLAPATVGARPRARWAFGGAVAAGLVLVAGTYSLLRPDATPAPAALASADRAPAATMVAAATPRPVTPAAEADEAVITDVRLVHDAQLDRYLDAHKQFSGTSALGLPSAFLRSATVDTASR